MNKQRIKWIIIPLICVLCLIIFGTDARADFGNFSGDTDFGGYDGGYDSFGGDYGDDDGFLTMIFYLIFSALPLPIKVIIIVALVVWYMFFRNKTPRDNRENRRTTTVQQGVTPTANQVQLSSIKEYVKLDPEFDVAAMNDKLSNLYVQMQNCWTDKDITPLRPYFTDAQYSQYERQLKESIERKETNHVDRIAVMAVNIVGFYQSGGNDHIIAQLFTRITTYTTSDETKEVIRGSKTAEKFMEYEWDLVRPTGTLTRKEGETVSISCPHCGAPIDINKSAKCPYCDSIVTVDDFDFVIYAIKGISQRTRG